MKKILLSELGKTGLDKTKFGLHNRRSGGTTAAPNLGVNGGLFKKHGRNKPQNVKNAYVHEEFQTLLSVSKNL